LPHIESLLRPDLGEVVGSSELVLVATRSVSKETLLSLLRPGQQVYDLVNIEKARRPEGPVAYEGICW